MNRTTNGVTTSVAVLASTIAMHPAFAAPGPGLPLAGSPTSISAGVFLPSGSDAKSAGGNSQLAFNFNYTLPVPNPASVPTQTVLSLGLESGTTAGKHYTIIPITAGQVVGLNGGSPTSGGQAYAGAGVGVYIINGSGFATAGRIGTYGELGYNITSNLYAEARYQDVSHASGFTLQAGLRF